MEDYEKKALDFLKQTNSTLEVEFLKFDYHFPGDTDKRNVFEVKLRKDDREYCFNFGDNLANISKIEQWKKAGKIFKPSNYEILSCLNSQEFENIDDFIDCFGYSPEDQKVSELLNTFGAVQNESKQLKYLYSDTELELLNDIN